MKTRCYCRSGFSRETASAAASRRTRTQFRKERYLYAYVKATPEGIASLCGESPAYEDMYA